MEKYVYTLNQYGGICVDTELMNKNKTLWFNMLTTLYVMDKYAGDDK